MQLRLSFALALWLSTAALLADPLAHWTQRSSPATPNHLLGITYAQDKFVAVGMLTFLHSTDGSNWYSGDFGGINPGIAYSVTATPAGFIAPGLWATINSSRDGTNWTRVTAPTNVYALTSVAYGNGTYVIVGDAVITSPDALNWAVQSMTNPPGVVSFINGQFWAGNYRTIMRSTNGTTWTRQYFPNTDWINSITYGDGIYVAVGSVWNAIAGASDCAILTSKDGLNWQLNPFFLRRQLLSVAYGAGKFLAIGDFGTILTSSDGITWTARDSGTLNNLKRVCYGNGTFVVVGENGTILQSDPIVNLEMSPTPPRLTVTGPSSRSCQIEYATGLASTNTWSPLTTVALTNAPVSVDLENPNSAPRFYRAVLLP